MNPLCALPEQVAGAADFEIAHRDLHAAAEMRELADRLEPRFGFFGERFVRLIEQIRVGLLIRASDASAQLIQIARVRICRRR